MEEAAVGNHSQTRGVDVRLIIFFACVHRGQPFPLHRQRPASRPIPQHAGLALTDPGLCRLVGGHRNGAVRLSAVSQRLPVCRARCTRRVWGTRTGRPRSLPLAQMSAHTFTMNLTIWLEAVTAMLVLVAVTAQMVDRLRNPWRPV